MQSGLCANWAKIHGGMKRCTRLLLLLSAAVMRLPHALPAEVRRCTPAPQRTHGAQSMCVLGVLVRSTSVHTVWETDVFRFCGACGGYCCCCHAALAGYAGGFGGGCMSPVPSVASSARGFICRRCAPANAWRQRKPCGSSSISTSAETQRGVRACAAT